MDFNLMTNISEPVQDDIEKSINNLTNTINAFEASDENLETVISTSPLRIKSLSGSFSLELRELEFIVGGLGH